MKSAKVIGGNGVLPTIEDAVYGDEVKEEVMVSS